MQTPHVTIVGAGIVGVSAAAWLQQSGWGVTLIDRVAPGDGCSFGNAGGIAFSDVVPPIRRDVLWKIPGWLLDPEGPFTVRWRHIPKALPWFLAAGQNSQPKRVRELTAARAALSLRSVSDLEALLAFASRPELLVKADALRLYDTEKRYLAEEPVRQLKREFGYESPRLSPGEIAELEPDVAKSFACGALYGGWYHVQNPKAVVSSIAEAIVKGGGEVIRDEVVRVDVAGGLATSLTLKGGSARRLDKLVVCAGAYSTFFTKTFGDRVMLEAERGYHLQISDPGVKIDRTLVSAGAPMAMVPMNVGLRLAGTDEIAGVDAPPNWRRSDILWRNAKRVLPKLHELTGTETRWMGRRPGTPDSIPVIGPSKKVGNVWYGFGHSHMGLTWGPTTGRLLREVMTSTPSNTDLSPFRVDRF